MVVEFIDELMDFASYCMMGFVFFCVALFGITKLTRKMLFDDDWMWSDSENEETKQKEDNYFNKK